MLNNCQFIGRLGDDPTTRFTPNGDAVANISLGCSEKWTDKQGQKQEKTEWVRGSAFGKLAEIIEKYCGKGDLLYISGKMQTRKYQAQDGSDRYATDINIREMKMLGSSGGAGSAGGSGAQAADNGGGSASQKPIFHSKQDVFDDSDIPF